MDRGGSNVNFSNLYCILEQPRLVFDPSSSHLTSLCTWADSLMSLSLSFLI